MGQFPGGQSRRKFYVVRYKGFAAFAIFVFDTGVVNCRTDVELASSPWQDFNDWLRRTTAKIVLS
jgi:hypothetical protein